MKGYLLLEDGTIFEGKIFGYNGNSIGEVVFNTSMTGYQEIVTDPSYFGQIVVMTYPLIGNYGINKEDFQSGSPSVSGFIVNDISDSFSNWRSDMSLEDYFFINKITGLSGIDTRLLVKKIREKGVMSGKIIVDAHPIDFHIEDVKNYFNYKPIQYVSTNENYIMEGTLGKIAVIDYGVKESILKELNKLGFELKVFNHKATAEEILSYGPDGVFLSNGPGNPADYDYEIYQVKNLIGKVPIYGICLGHQLISLALGGQTKKLKFGHRGANQPVKDLQSNKILITSQNHGYEVVEKSLPVNDIEITHLNVNDKSLEGFRSKKYNILSIQFHPESSPGPNDSLYHFAEFKDMILDSRGELSA